MAKAACTYNPDNDLAKFINKYMNECNYTISTLGIYLTGNVYQCKKIPWITLLRVKCRHLTMI